MENLVCFFITLLKISFHYIFSTFKIFNHLFIDIEHTHISPISENEILHCFSCQVFTGLFPSTSMSVFDFLFLFLPCLNLCVCVFKYSFIWLHQVSSCGTQDLLCSMQDLVPQSGNEPRLPHWEFRDPVTDLAGKSLYVCFYLQFSSVAQSCPTFCDPMNRSRPGPPVHHQLPEFFSNKVRKQATYIK